MIATIKRLLFFSAITAAGAHADMPSINSFPFRRIPGAVSASALQVLRIHTTGDKAAFTLDTSNKESAKEDEKTFRSTGAVFVADQIAFCSRAGIKNCPVYSNEFIGSGFFVGEPRTFITNYHLLHQLMIDGFKTLPDSTDVRNLLQALIKLPLYIKAYTADGTEVITTMKSPRAVRVEALNPSVYYLVDNDPLLFAKDVFGQLSDIMQLSTAQAPHVGSLRLAASPAFPGDELFAVGYPEDMPGVAGKFKIAAGKALTAEDFTKIMNVKDTPEFAELRRHFLIYGDFECNIGNSGGPILNTWGEVVGVVGGWYENTKTHQSVCYGVNLLALPELKAYWETVNRKALSKLRR